MCAKSCHDIIKNKGKRLCPETQGPLRTVKGRSCLHGHAGADRGVRTRGLRRGSSCAEGAASSTLGARFPFICTQLSSL